MQPSTDQRHATAASPGSWRPRSAAARNPTAADPRPYGAHDTTAPVLPLPNPLSHARPHRRRHRPNRRPAPPQDRAPLAAAPAPAPAPVITGVPQLVQEIQDKLARGAVECMICYDAVRRAAPVWSCASCYSIFHLPCIRRWARAPASSVSSPASWRCPGCQSVHAVPARDIAYTCFCGRRRDPPNDLFLTPHSCGEPCCKPLGTPTTDCYGPYSRITNK